MANSSKYIGSNWKSSVFRFDQSFKNAYVHTSAIAGNLNGVFGRLVQVREYDGAFGSHTFLIRESDGSLSSHHNQSLCIIDKVHHDELNELFKDVYLDDADQHEYSIDGENVAKGFIVKNPNK